MTGPEMGDVLDRAWEVIITNRRFIGGAIVAVAGTYSAFDGHSRIWEGLGALGLYLTAAGATESDQHKAARLKWERAGNEDRRE